MINLHQQGKGKDERDVPEGDHNEREIDIHPTHPLRHYTIIIVVWPIEIVLKVVPINGEIVFPCSGSKTRLHYIDTDDCIYMY